MSKVQSTLEQVRNEGEIPSPVRLKNLLPIPVVSKLEVTDKKDNAIGFQLEGLQGTMYLLDQPTPMA